MVKNQFFLNISKNIDIWILDKEQNLFRIQKWSVYVCTNFGQEWLRNARQKSKMADTKFSYFCIYLTSDRGDYPRIIVIALFHVFSPRDFPIALIMMISVSKILIRMLNPLKKITGFLKFENLVILRVNFIKKRNI